MSTNGWGGSGDWRDTEFGHGQERYYGGEHRHPAPPPGERRPAPDQPQPPTGRGSSKGPLLAVAGVLVLALAAGGAFLATRGGAEADAAGATTTGAATTRPTASVQADRGASSTNPTDPQRNSGGEADHAAFVVPPPGSFTTGKGAERPVWQMYEDPRDIAGYGSRTGKNLAVGHAPTTYRDGFCPKTPASALGMLVWANAHAENPLEAASDTGDTWLKAVATRDDNRMEKYSTSPSIKNVTLKHSKTKAVQFRGKTPLTSDSETKCGVTGAEVVVTAFETGHGTATMVAVRRLGHTDSMSNAQLSTILNSLRPT